VSLLLTFATIHDALAAEKSASDIAFEGRKPELRPLPPSVKSDCGFGLWIEGAHSLADPPVAALYDRGARIAAAYRFIEKERSYERIDQKD
jgi:hypothetical protein